MNTINGRYLLLGQSEMIQKGISTVIAKDRLNESEVDLFLVEGDSVPKRILEYMESIYHKVENIRISEMMRVLDFQLIESTDGKEARKKMFLLVLERSEGESFLSASVEMDYSQILEWMISFIQTLNHLLLKGVVWNYFDPRNVFLLEEENGVKKLILRDPISAAVLTDFERFSSYSSAGFGSYDSKGFDFSLQELGALFMSLFLRRDRREDFASALSFFKEQIRSVQGRKEPEIIAYILESLLNDSYIKRPFVFSAIIEDVNQKFGTDFQSILIDDMQNLSMSEHMIVKEKYYRQIETQYQYIMSREIANKILFIHVSKEQRGHLLDDLIRRLSFWDVPLICHRVRNEEEYTNEWLKKFRNFRYSSFFVDEFGGKEVFLKKYEELLRHGSFSRERMKDKGILRLLTVAAKSLLENRGEEFAVYIFTDFENINPYIVATLYYTLHFSKKHRYLLIAFSNLEDKKEELLCDLQDALVSEGKAEKLSVQFLMIGELKVFLQDLCFRRDLPQEFTDLVYQQTDGRSKFLFDLLIECVKDGVLFFDDASRTVQLSDDYVEYFTRRTQINSDYRNSRYSELSEEIKGLAKLMSVLLLPHEAAFYQRMLKVNKSSITRLLSELEKNRLLDVEIQNGTKMFELTRRDPHLRNFIYNDLSIEEKKSLHRHAMSMVHPESDQEYYAFARHFYAMGDEESLEKGANILMELGKKFSEAMDYEKAIDFYERSLQGKMEDETRFRVYLRLFLYSLHIGKSEQMSLFVDQLEALCKKPMNVDLLAEYYGRYILIYFGMQEGDEERRERFFLNLEKIFQETPTQTVSVYYYGVLGRRARNVKEYEKSSKYYLKSVELCEEQPEFYLHCSLCYRHLGLNAFYQKKFEECIEWNQQAIKYAKLAGDIRGETAAINNMAVAYEEHKPGSDKKEECYKENLRLGRLYGIAHTEVVSLLNLSFFESSRNNLRLGYEYAKAAFIRSEESGEYEKKITILKTLIHFALQTGDLSIAYEYFREGEKHTSQTLYQDEHFGFYQEAQHLFFKLRNFEAVRETVQLNISQFPNTHMSSLEGTELYRILCEILIDGKDREEALISFLETSMPVDEYDRRELTGQLYRILFLFHTCDLKEKYASFVEKVLEVDGLNLETYAFQIFFKHPDSKELTEEELNSLIEHVDRDEKNNENIQIRLYLAEYYIRENRPWAAVTMILEAAQNVVDCLRNIPFSDRKNVFEFNGYTRIFDFLEHFEERGGVLLPIERAERKTSYDVLERYLYRMDLEEWARRFDVPENLNRERNRFIEHSLRFERAIAEFGDNFELNLKIILQAVAKRMMATEIYLCTLRDSVYHPEILLMNASEEKFMDLSRILDLSRFNVVQNLSTSNYHWRAVTTVPVFSPEHDNNVEGLEAPTVVIFTSTRTVHRLNEKGYDEMKGHMSALSLLVENYQLSRVASIDRLTGTLTRRSLDEELIYRFVEARQSGYPLSVLMYDLDHFKKVNDTYGHTTGDVVLREMAKVSMQLLTGDIKVGRYGGEEFLAVLPRRTAEEAAQIGEQLRNQVAEHNYKDLSDFRTTVSIGISTLQSNQDTIASLLERADEALYKAKSDGRNKVVVWKSGMEVKKSGMELAKGIFTGNATKDASHQLAFLELLRDSSMEMSESDAVFNILSRMLDVLEAYEVVVVNVHSKTREGFSLRRGDMRLYDASMADQRILDEIIGNPGGFYRITWEEQSAATDEAGFNSWDSVLGLDIVDQGETCALMYFRVSLREKEFGKNDLNLATIFSTFLAEYL